jgi:hypothetical protein
MEDDGRSERRPSTASPLMKNPGSVTFRGLGSSLLRTTFPAYIFFCGKAMYSEGNSPVSDPSQVTMDCTSAGASSLPS